MKYNIYINQYSAIGSGLDLDLIDLAIFDMIKDFANCAECVKINTQEGVFFWVSAQKIMADMPLLGIKTKNGVMKHIDRLCNAGVLVKHPNCQQYKMQLYQFGENYEKLLYTSNEPVPTKIDSDYEQKLIVTTNKSCDYNNINNNIEEKITDKSVMEKEAEKETKTLFSNSKIGKLGKENFAEFEAQFNAPEYADIDLYYYYHSVSDWSDTSNTKRTNRGWIATIRTFIRKDIERGALHRIAQMTNNGLFSQTGIDYLNM